MKLTDKYKNLLKGLDLADSISISLHKWMYQPKGSGIIFFKNSYEANKSVSFKTGYLSKPNVGILGSTPLVALPLIAILIAWGRKGLSKHIEADMEKAESLVKLIKNDPRFELWGPNKTGVVVWRSKKINPQKVRENLKNAWVSLVEIDGSIWFRSVAANPYANPQHLFDQILKALN